MTLRLISALFLGLVTLNSVANADVLNLEYIKTNLGGGTYQYDFKLILTNADNSYSAGQGWNWIIFGDIPSATSPLSDFNLLSETFPNPNMGFSSSSGGHNGPTFIDSINFSTDGWIPNFVGDFVTWSGTSGSDIPDGSLLFSTLVPINGANVADFQVANAVPEPTSMGVMSLAFAGLCLVRRKRD